MKFAAIVCPRCRGGWTVESRHESARCPRCNTTVTVKERKAIWEGDDIDGGQAALAIHNGGSGLTLHGQRPRSAAALPHESATMAAASQATGIVNRSEKAEAVARALFATSTATHDDLLQALVEAGLDTGRAEVEIIRLLGTDFLMEPRPGRYCLVG